MANNTFLGLKPYTEADTYRFKGRSVESEELSRLIIRNYYTVCYGESGEGKTSLLNAGVFPLLRKNMFFPIEITFIKEDFEVSPDKFDDIIDRCIQDSINDYNKKNSGINVEYKCYTSDFNNMNMETQSQLKEKLAMYSWWKIRNYKPTAMGVTFTPVFVFDQFEEVFSQPSSIVWTEVFFKWLEEVTSDSCPEEIIKTVRNIIGEDAAFPKIKEEKRFKMIFSLRNEFIGELDFWAMQEHFIPELKENRYYLKPLTYVGAKMIMTQQGAFNEDKAEEILVHLVKKHSKEPERTINKNLPVIPALLLSIICESWERNNEFFSTIDPNEIEQSLNQIIERFYDDAIETVLNELSSKNSNNRLKINDFRNDINTAVFALVDERGKRERIKTTTSQLAQVDFDTKYKDILKENRIIRTTKNNGEDYVELVHDALCPIIVQKKSAEALKRDKQKQREQLRKRGKFIIIAITITGLVISNFAQFKQRKDLKKQNTELSNQKQKLNERISELEHYQDSTRKEQDVQSSFNSISSNPAFKQVNEQANEMKGQEESNRISSQEMP